jgi:hypothetical protein
MIEDALDREADYSRMRDIYSNGDSSYRRGRDAQTGQYVSRGDRPYLNYSYGMSYNGSPKQNAINDLEQAMHSAPTEQERMMYQGMINDLQMNR